MVVDGCTAAESDGGEEGELNSQRLGRDGREGY